MFRLYFVSSLVAGALLSGAGIPPTAAQNANADANADANANAGSGAFHAFTNKDGRQVNARIVSVSPDRRTMKISLEDGREADLDIVALTLDDQQYLKNWLASQPMLASYRLEVSVEKTAAAPEERRREEYYKLNTRHQAWRITIKNVSRETLAHPTVEYYLLKDEAVRIYEDTGRREWTFTTVSTEEPNREPEKTHGVVELEDLVYNREQVVTTDPVDIDEVLGDGNVLYAEDKSLGVILQVRDDFGNIVGTFRSSETGIRNVRWEDVAGAGAGEPGSAASSTVASSPNGSPVEQRELETWPDVFQKGEFVRTRLAPDPEGRTITLVATVDIDENNPDGTIVAYGGKNKGCALVVADGELQLWMRRDDSLDGQIQSHLTVPASDLPAGEFVVEATNTADAMSIAIDGEVKASGPSVGALDSKPAEGISVGFDSGTQTVGPNPPPDLFAGAIRDVRFELGN